MSTTYRTQDESASASLLARWLKDPEAAVRMIGTARRNPGTAVVSAGSETSEAQICLEGSVLVVTRA